MELEQAATGQEVGHGCRRTQRQTMAFAQPAAAAVAATIQVGSNSMKARPQFKYVGSLGQADGGQERPQSSSRGGCAQQGRSADPSRQLCSPP